MSSKRRHHRDDQSGPAFVDPDSPSARVTKAVQVGNIFLLRRLLTTHFDPYDGTLMDPRNPDPVTRKTTLMIAAENSNVEMCRILIEEFQVEHIGPSRDLELNTILHVAAQTNQQDLLLLYYQYYPEVLDWPNTTGMTALHVASQKGFEEMVGILLDFKADIDVVDQEGNTSLHYAAGWGHLKVVQLLIDRGCQFWIKNNYHFSASDYSFSFTIQSALQDHARTVFDRQKMKQKEKARAERQRQKSDDKAKAERRNMNRSTSTEDDLVVSSLPRKPSIATLASTINIEDALGAPATVPSRSASLPAVGTLANPRSNSSTSPSNLTPSPATTHHSGPPQAGPMKPSASFTIGLSSIPALSSPSSAIFGKVPASPGLDPAMTARILAKDQSAMLEFRNRAGSTASSVVGGGAWSPVKLDSPSVAPLGTPTTAAPLNIITASATAPLATLKLDMTPPRVSSRNRSRSGGEKANSIWRRPSNNTLASGTEAPLTTASSSLSSQPHILSSRILTSRMRERSGSTDSSVSNLSLGGGGGGVGNFSLRDAIGSVASAVTSIPVVTAVGVGGVRSRLGRNGSGHNANGSGSGSGSLVRPAPLQLESVPGSPGPQEDDNDEDDDDERERRRRSDSTASAGGGGDGLGIGTAH